MDIGGTARIFQETFGISIEYRGPSGEYREDIGGSRGNLGRIVKDIGGNSGGTSGKFWRISGEPRGYFRKYRESLTDFCVRGGSTAKTRQKRGKKPKKTNKIGSLEGFFL